MTMYTIEILSRICWFWKRWKYKGYSVEISVNIIFEVKVIFQKYFICRLISLVTRLAGLVCTSSCAGHDADLGRDNTFTAVTFGASSLLGLSRERWRNFKIMQKARNKKGLKCVWRKSGIWKRNETEITCEWVLKQIGGLDWWN
jgi:hypothetical protein